MYNYKIKILCKTEDILCYNNENSSNKHLFCNNEDISTNHLLFYNNKEISKKNPNKQNLKKLNNTIIEKALILHKKIINNTTTIKKALLQKQVPNFTTKPLKFICKCGNEISAFDFESFTTKSSLEFMCKRGIEILESDFQNFIKLMKDIGFSSSESNTINLIKINNNKSEEIICKYNFQAETKIPIKNNYKIKIECTSKDELCYNNEEISININNNLNLKELIDNTNYINDFKYINLKTKSLEFNCNSKILDINFKFILKNFIKDMQNIGFFSNKDIHIDLICNKNIISKYKFQSIIKIPIYIYSTQCLYKNYNNYIV
jgi:predicted transport protein